VQGAGAGEAEQSELREGKTMATHHQEEARQAAGPGAAPEPPAASLGLRVLAVTHRDEDGKLWAEVPAIPGCVAEGDTQEELLANLREAVRSCLLVTPGDFTTPEPGTVAEIDL
jgi:hypothetical protein